MDPRTGYQYRQVNVSGYLPVVPRGASLRVLNGKKRVLGFLKKGSDGHGRAKDNIWIERFGRTIKYEYIYIQSEENGAVPQWLSPTVFLGIIDISGW